MAIINKEDLFYKNYSWTVYAKDNPKITGEPDSTLLNRKEGYEILYFVNKFCDIFKLKNKSSATKVERMIRNVVPDNIRSQEKIKNWIAENWKEYSY